MDDRSVFVIHGRNDGLRTAMFDFLRSINLKPIEWTEAIKLTRMGSPYVGDVLKAAFDRAVAVVVLMTPDEVAYLQPQYGHGDHDPEVNPAAQARPNVLFEAGMALGRNENQTILVEIGEVRPFSDVAGRHVVRLSNEVATRQAFAQRLETAGCKVDLTGTDWHVTGDFSPPMPPGNGALLGRSVPAPSPSPSIEFDVRYVNKGTGKVDKLQVFNNGGKVAYNVEVSLPREAALNLLEPGVPISKIPGGGKWVTLDVMNRLKVIGGPRRISAFDVTLKAKADNGDIVEQEVFIDINS